MGIEEARDLANIFITSLDKPVTYFSNCFCDDDVSGIRSWNPVTSYTFESILYCEMPKLSVLVVCIDED
jgi:hypothetical protein